MGTASGLTHPTAVEVSLSPETKYRGLYFIDTVRGPGAMHDQIRRRSSIGSAGKRVKLRG